MLRFKPEALTPRQTTRSTQRLNTSSSKHRKFSNIDLDLDDCFSDVIEPDLILQSGASLRVPASHVTLMEAEQGVKAALFNKLLADGVRFDERHFYSQAALFLAAEHDSVDALELLASAGVDFNLEDMFGETALYTAIAHRAANSAAWLVKHGGVSVNHKTPEGETALHVAAMTSPALVEVLVDAGADVDAPKTKGVTPLMMAAVNHSDSVSLLLRHGADVNAVNIFGDTALLYAVRSGNVDTARLLAPLVDDVDFGGHSNRGYTYGCVRLDTPLRVAIDGRNPEIVELLLEAGADPDGGVRSLEARMLHVAAGYQLQHFHSPMEATWSSAFTPPADTPTSTSSSISSTSSSSSIIKSLIKHGARVDPRDKFGHTPLMCATRTRDLAAIGALIDAGADVNLANSTGYTALSVAVFRRDVPVLRLLMERGGARPGFELHLAIFTSQDVVEALVEAGATPTLAPCKSFTNEPSRPVSPLYVALRFGFLNIASFFISRGFLSKWDLLEIPTDYKVIQLLNEHKYYKGGIPDNISSLFDVEDLQSPMPSSLFLWSYVAVTSRLEEEGCSGRQRSDKVKQLGLPVPLQKKLLHQSEDSQLR